MKRTLTRKLGALGVAALAMLAISGPLFTATVRADDADKPPLTDEEKRRFLERLKGSLSTGVDMRIPPLTIGLAYMVNSDYAKAIEQFDKAIADNPQSD